MVQIILLNYGNCGGNVNTDFISHMVQIILADYPLMGGEKYLFISHMVQIIHFS